MTRSSAYEITKPAHESVQTHSRPTRSEMWPSAIWPTMPVNPTKPSAQAATAGAKPISIKYLVWCTCTAYHAQSPPKNPIETHQKRAVRMARARVQSIDAQA